MADAASFSFDTSSLPGDEAFEAWRGIMSRMFRIERARPESKLPRGALSAFLLGDVMANRSSFNVQRLSRDTRRIEDTPDHLVLQLYRSGGFAGEVEGTPVKVARGQVAVCDLRLRLDVRANVSNTIGLTIPRYLLDGITLPRAGARLDPAREGLLAARIALVHQNLPTTVPADPSPAVAGLVAALRRLFDPSSAADVLDAPELDADLVTVAERIIAGLLPSGTLSPETVADRLQVSRATLYRAFAPLGGVMQHVWRMRLEAVRAALDSPAEPRTLARLAEDHGFKTAAHLSRNFKARFGMTPSDWRTRKSDQLSGAWQPDLSRLNETWQTLGRPR